MGICLYQVLSNWFHRPWPYSNQVPNVYKSDALFTKLSSSYRSSRGDFIVTFSLVTKKDSKAMMTMNGGAPMRVT